MATPATPIGFETETLIADDLYRAAMALATAMRQIDEMGRAMHPAIDADPTSADTILIDGEPVLAALKAMALRIDRTVADRSTSPTDD
jgi:2-oxo-4-hydroxy-4-carboxy--5-ureidoimidazoline (OHCU) decarboxylase